MTHIFFAFLADFIYFWQLYNNSSNIKGSSLKEGGGGLLLSVYFTMCPPNPYIK